MSQPAAIARWPLLLLCLDLASGGQALGEDRPTSAKLPAITRPVLFNTPEADKIMAHLAIFPPDDPWNSDVSGWPVAADSDALIGSIGRDKPLRANADMGFVIVPADQPKIDVRLTEYRAESDPGPYPVPDNLPIEGWPAGYRRNPATAARTLDEVQRDARGEGGDRHAIVVDPAHQRLYEFYAAKKTDGGWEAAQASVFDLATNKPRPLEWTSTDAAGLPILPAIVRHDEIERGLVGHALRVTVKNTRRAFVAPARHFASNKTDPSLPRMGERIRLKADYDITGFSPAVRAILKGLKKHGMLVADNGIDWAISVAPDERIPEMHEELRRVKGSAFEVVRKPE